MNPSMENTNQSQRTLKNTENALDALPDEVKREMKETLEDHAIHTDRMINNQPQHTPNLRKVNLPTSGCSVPLFPGLSPPLQHLLRERTREGALPLCLAPPALLQRVQEFPLISVGSPEDWAELALRIVGSGMGGFCSGSDLLVINGFFTTPKPDGSQRFIVDARRANLFFLPPPNPNLPRPDHIANARFPPGATVRAALCDLTHHCDQLSLLHPQTRCLIRHFGLPEVPRHLLPPEVQARFPIGPIHVALHSVPQGWAWGVTLAQDHHRHLLLRLPRRTQLLHTSPGATCHLRPGVVFVLVCIDDVLFLGLSDGTLLWAIRQCRSLLRESGLQESPSKAVPPTTTARICGIALDTNLLRPRWATLASLVRDTRALLRASRTTTREVEALLGRWVWILLLNRPLLSIPQAVCGFTADRRTPPTWLRALHPAVRREFRLLVTFLPFVRAHLSLPPFHRLVATDASTWGQGVSIAAQPLRSGPHLPHPFPPPPLCVELPNLLHLRLADWTHIVSSRWAIPPEHTNVLEMRALLTAVRWVTSSPLSNGTVLTVHCDSQAVVGAVTTGRSRSRQLNRLPRRLTSLLLAANPRLRVVWTPTALNPADEPSRKQDWRGRHSPSPGGGFTCHP